MLIGYVRISKHDGSQSFDLEKDALVKEGIDPEKIYEDSTSGKHDSRPGLDACLKSLRQGDTLVVWKLDRLGRDLKNLINIIDNLRSKNIKFKVLTGHGAQIDTSTAHGRMAFGIFASLAEYERELISERTRAGLAAARARGKLGGRRRIMTAKKIRIAMGALSDRNTEVRDILDMLGVKKSTLYYYVSPIGEPKEPAKKILERADKAREYLQNGK